MKSPFHVMIIPTLGCPSNCVYCWSSEENSPVMTIDTVKKTVGWLKNLKDYQVTVTFHGGEPLLAGAGFFREALLIISEGLKHLEPAFAIQTNLWRMTPEIAKIFAEYNIPVGSSIDGPKEINDIQRGCGYYDKNMEGCRIAKENGLDVKYICTFTADSYERKEEIFKYFMDNGLPLKLHPALPSLRGNEPQRYALAPEKYGELLVYLLDMAIMHMDKAEIMNINDLIRCVFTRRGSVCTFADCMGTTFAIGPDGGIYPCYRFVGMQKYLMGNVHDNPKQEEIESSKAWRLMQDFKGFVDENCRDCRHISYCRGGCPYNAIAPTGGRVEGVDPHCPAYKRIFDEISDRIDSEMFAEPPSGMGIGGFGPASRRRRRKAGVTDLMHKIVMK
ncbi:MAG: TIGR04083 family peptide-modifying radical SAM enzyme [Methanomicrobium sp.]|nr:TIGR04083 family peptide-modifying radical SAM enzyme [Methanomicrobium sp.]MDD4299351.1 TIGR04083 family peptide-modifying radical SAM enzyme [Methanomicrobium sp.]